MYTFLIVLTLTLGTAFCLYMILKSENACSMHLKLLKAIDAYNISSIDKREYDKIIPYDLLEDYDTTLWRLFDWGYTRILPPDILELVKPYIEEGNHENS